MSEVTDWYPASVKPVRVGWYECQFHIGTLIRYWNGNIWVSDSSRFGYGWAPLPWRGLKEPALPDNREVSDGS